MGVGHVPPGSLPAEGDRAHVPRREHRRAGAGRSNLTSVGRAGERIAARFLEERGAEVVGRNIRTKEGEIDLLARFGRERVVVEVKSGWLESAEAFTVEKARRLMEAGASLDPPAFRIDLVTVRFARDGVTVRWVPRAA